MTKKPNSKTIESSEQSLVKFLVFFLVIGLASSSPISNDLVQPHGSIGRSILQLPQKTRCPTDYSKTVNYKIVTESCKLKNGMSTETCCKPLRTIICPVVKETEDSSTNCYDTFMRNLYIAGSYPPNAFDMLCAKDVHPTDCPVGGITTNNGVFHGSSSSSLVLMSMLLAGLAM